jgi:hypothetical protein
MLEQQRQCRSRRGLEGGIGLIEDGEEVAGHDDDGAWLDWLAVEKGQERRGEGRGLGGG